MDEIDGADGNAEPARPHQEGAVGEAVQHHARKRRPAIAVTMETPKTQSGTSELTSLWVAMRVK